MKNEITIINTNNNKKKNKKPSSSSLFCYKFCLSIWMCAIFFSHLKGGEIEKKGKERKEREGKEGREEGKEGEREEGGGKK